MMRSTSIENADPPAVGRLLLALALSAALHAWFVATLASAPPESVWARGREQIAEPLRATIFSVDSSAGRARDAVLAGDATSGAAERPAPASEPRADRPWASPPSLPEAATGGPQGGTYYLPAQLDVRPALIKAEEPQYPERAPPEGGYLVLHLFVNAKGTIDRVEIVLADPPNVFDEAAKAAFSTARFTPGVKAGVPVATRLAIEMQFHPLVTLAAPSDGTRALSATPPQAAGANANGD